MPAKKKAVKKKKIAQKGSVTRHLEKIRKETYSEAKVISILDEDLLEAWEKLRSFAESLGPQRIYASVLAIMFAKKICYFYARPKKKYIEVWIFLPRKIEGLTFMQLSSKKEKFSNMFKLVHADQVEEPLTDWIREAFEFAP